jgi:NADPH-dependent ferric siderophore reductase
VKRNWEGLVLKALGGRDYRLTVVGAERVNDHYHRLLVDGGGLLEANGVHPTMWIRLWFDNSGKPHQRAYTLVDPDPATGRFSLEFAVHDGCAVRWALGAAPGDTVDATMYGSSFALPDPLPAHLYMVGDAASVPAANSLFDALFEAAPDVPATVWLEYAHDDERDLPLRARAHHRVAWVPRKDDGQLLVDTVSAEVPAADDAFYWVAAEAAGNRAIARHLRKVLGIPKHRVYSLAYWSAR